jgi:hypothetical protein
MKTRRAAVRVLGIAARALVAVVAVGALLASGAVPVQAMECVPLRIEPASLRVATSGAAELRAVGGSGNALFSLDGDPRGARVEPGGGLRAGAAAAHFTAIARDGACRAEARASVDVVGPFDVRPKRITLAPRASVRFEASGAIGDVAYAILDHPRAGSGRLTQDTFVAGDVDGIYRLVAVDGKSGREARLEVEVGKPRPLRPRTEVLAVPAGGRVRLEWEGG